jgi:hypothetical protein
MKKLVIIPGGFHPFHAGHKALYDAAAQAFPNSDIYVAATADTSSRPFPFEVKEKLARLAGIPKHRFIQVKSPFQAKEITQHFDPDNTQLIFVRSEKDRGVSPLPDQIKKDGTPGYLKSLKRNNREPMSRSGYMAYLPVVQFGPGMTSGTEIRNKWPEMTVRQKADLVQQLYPAAAGNERLIGNVMAMLDHVIGAEQKEKTVDEATVVNDPDSGLQIRPTGGFGTWDEESLVSSLAGQLAEIAQKIRDRDYAGVEWLLYNGGAIEAKVRALARFSDFKKKQGRRPIARGREVDIGEADYLDEIA